MQDSLRSFDTATRRSFLETAARTMLGVSAFSASGALSLADEEGGNKKKKPKPRRVFGAGKAKQVIYIFLNGAMTHLDTFDLKPGSETQGETKPLKTNVPGIIVGDQLPKIAEQMDKVAVVNSLYQETAAHEPGRYLMRTSYKKIATTRHPAMGAWAQELQGKRLRGLPDNVLISGGARHPGAGFLPPSHTPLPIGNPNDGLKNTTSPEYLTDKMFRTRMRLVKEFDAEFQKKYKQKQVAAYNDFYDQATTLLASEELKAFDLKNEKQEVRDEYGMNNFGQGLLLARRLVEEKVRFIEVTYGGWDMHRNIYTSLPNRASVFDQGVSTLLADLEDRGLLNETLVVVATEFGRKPKINQNAGRDHHPAAFSGIMAGGGIKGGRKYGKSDDRGHSVEEDPVSVSDYNATIAYAMGLDIDKEVSSPTGRPFKAAHDGVPIKTLFG